MLFIALLELLDLLSQRAKHLIEYCWLATLEVSMQLGSTLRVHHDFEDFVHHVAELRSRHTVTQRPMNEQAYLPPQLRRQGVSAGQ